MPQLMKNASAGTMESSDVYVEIFPGEEIDIEIDSVVEAQFGPSIRATVTEVLSQMGVTGAHVRLVDRGALDCVIRARVETAAARAKGE